MAEERLRTPRSPIVPTLVALAAISLGGPRVHAAEDETSIGLTKASQRGAFNVGSATANVGLAPGPDGEQVLKLDYSAPQGTAVGVWTKGFPAGLDAAHVDIVRFAASPANPDQVGMVAVALEIKGSVGTSRIPLDLGPGWTAEERMVDWKAIGSPNEVVVSVSRVGDGPTASGTLLLDVRFERLSPLRKLSTSQPARLGGVMLVAGLAALLAWLLNSTFPGPAGGWPTLGRSLGRDLIRGIGSVAILGLAGVVYALGEMGPLEVGWSPLGLAIAGAGLAEWWKIGLTGRHLSSWEAFRDSAVTGILASSSSPLAILQAPGNWSELILLSQPVAAVVTLLYHASLAIRLGSSGKHLGPVSAAMIVGTPFAVGALLLLEPGGLVGGLGEFLGFGALAGRPELAGAIGRVVVLFAFNEWLALMLGLATKRTILRSPLAHLMLFAVAVAAIAGPWVAALGSAETVATWPAIARLFAVVASTILSQAGLWAEAYLVTGLVTDALRGGAPSRATVVANPVLGVRKGMVYSGVYIGGLYVLAIVCAMPWVHWLAMNAPLPLAAIAGAIVFPLIKTIIETFDGSQAFFRRVASGYRSPTLYARGAVAGSGLGFAFSRAMPGADMLSRVEFGFLIGFAAYAGVNLLRDLFAASADRGRPQSWRVYLVQGLLGGAIGAAIGFYLDAVQVEVIVTKFHRYVDPGQKPTLYDVYPLLSKWGHINIGDVSGGSSLLFAEALAGVISWSIPSWLFAINRTFMAAYFEQQSAPIRALFTREGLIQLVESMIGVLRWGLWMSPIINSFLRPMGEPTWYNQDGAIHTVIAVVRDATTTHQAFQTWSLAVFIGLLAHDWFRVLIWLDHMGLRVATLVNLSFLGMDRLDRRLSRFLAPAATARCIPEAVKRFTTWAPLLIPYYIPKGRDWDVAWDRSQAIIRAEHGSLISWVSSLSMAEQGMFLIGSIALGSAVFATARLIRGRSGARTGRWWRLNNAEYEVNLRENGEIFSVAKGRGYDVSRRSYDFLDPAGRAVFLVDETGAESVSWPLIGNLPGDPGDGSRFERVEDALKITNASNGLVATIEITLPDAGDAAEIWSIRVENLTDSARRIKIVPYLEWVLNKAEADRGHTQYNRLFAEVEYARGLHAVLAWDKHSKAMGVLASDVEPDGFLSARVDFIGRARSLGSPRVLETMAFFEAKDTDAHPTFDPIGALAIGLNVPARGEATARLLIGLVADKKAAIDLVSRHLHIPLASAVPAERRRKLSHAIGHGDIPAGTPEPYTEFSEDGRKLLVRTPFTTRPFDHTLANALGHVVVVTNRGLHTTASVNSQQNRVTPDWSDTVTKEVPSEAIYIYDNESDEWYSPTYHPLNDPEASHEAEFGVDGTAVFRMTKGEIETELTVFVPPDEPAGIYLLTVRNRSDRPLMLRVAPYFQLVLSGQPEFSGPLKVRDDFLDEKIPILSFVNPRNTYRTGPAFVAIGNVEPPDEVATTRGRFFGPARDPARPAMVAGDGPTEQDADDDRPIAAFLATMAIHARGEETIVVILGQADNMEQARSVVQKYRDLSEARAGLEKTRRWWVGFDGHRLAPHVACGVRPLPRLAQIPGPRRADLGPSRVLPGERGVRLPRPVAGCPSTSSGSIPRWLAGRFCCTGRSNFSKATSSTGSTSSRTAGPGSSAGRMRRTTSSGSAGRSSSTSGRPGMRRSSTKRPITSNPTSRSSRCRPEKVGWGSTRSDRRRKNRSIAIVCGRSTSSSIAGWAFTASP